MKKKQLSTEFKRNEANKITELKGYLNNGKLFIVTCKINGVQHITGDVSNNYRKTLRGEKVATFSQITVEGENNLAVSDIKSTYKECQLKHTDSWHIIERGHLAVYIDFVAKKV